MSIVDLKNSVKHFVLRGANIRRVHIVGCSRSGTTMLHYALAAFENTILYDKETSTWSYPTLKDSALLFGSYVFRPGRYYLVTKREWGWWEDSQLERLAKLARNYGIFVINLARDPRDVLTSKYALGEKRFYVDPEFWEKSTVAAERLMQILADHPLKMTLRYEDIILKSGATQQLLQEKIGFRLREGLQSWSKLKDNMKPGSKIGEMFPNMHNLRNFDARSIGKWRADPDLERYLQSQLNTSPQRLKLKEFIAKYGYE